ncbi:Serine/arginine-rich splicing factor 12 [Podila horticola]|nr:Serine/arginine-rich splicing factor 12 [Podila horticola]
MPRYPENRNFSLYVTGFSEATRPILLTKLFERHGPVADVYMPKDWQTHQHRGFAYVVFEKDEDAQSAVESTESFVLDGRVLSVQFARGSKRGSQMKGRRQEHPMEIPNQSPEHTRQPSNAPFANHQKHSRNASQSSVRRIRRHAHARPPCHLHARHCCLHIKREPTPSASSCSSSCSCSRSPSPMRTAPVRKTRRSPEQQYVYAESRAHESRHHRRRYRSEEASVSPEPEAKPEAPMSMPKREDAKRPSGVRNGSVHKDEISLSVDDRDW